VKGGISLLNVYYLHDLEKWELRLYAERPEDDVVLGRYDTYEEAILALDLAHEKQTHDH
jgi:hypothetical protein